MTMEHLIDLAGEPDAWDSGHADQRPCPRGYAGHIMAEELGAVAVFVSGVSWTDGLASGECFHAQTGGFPV